MKLHRKVLSETDIRRIDKELPTVLLPFNLTRPEKQDVAKLFFLLLKIFPKIYVPIVVKHLKNIY